MAAMCECKICRGDVVCGGCGYSYGFKGKLICINPVMRESSLRYEGCEYEVRHDYMACHEYDEHGHHNLKWNSVMCHRCGQAHALCVPCAR